MQSGNREIGNSASRLNAVVSVQRYAEFAQRILLNSKIGRHGWKGKVVKKQKDAALFGGNIHRQSEIVAPLAREFKHAMYRAGRAGAYVLVENDFELHSGQRALYVIK